MSFQYKDFHLLIFLQSIAKEETENGIGENESAKIRSTNLSDTDEKEDDIVNGEEVKNTEDENALPALCQELYKSTTEFLSKVPNLTDSEESETSDDDDFEIDDRIKSINGEFESDTADESEYIGVNDNEETNLLAFCQNLHESTNDSKYDGDFKVHENSEKIYIEEKQECPFLSALCQKYESTSLFCKYTIETEPLKEIPDLTDSEESSESDEELDFDYKMFQRNKEFNIETLNGNQNKDSVLPALCQNYTNIHLTEEDKEDGNCHRRRSG